MQRRDFLIGTAASSAMLAAPALAAQSAVRQFRILRAGSDIGTHSLDARLGPEGFEIDIVIDIRVKVLGITAYRYLLQNREIWQGGRLVRLTSRTNDDGEENFATIERKGAQLSVEGSAYSGGVAADAATTSYYTTDFLRRSPWISTQSGLPLNVAVAETAPRTWAVTGELETQLSYDAAGEWVGCSFDAGGEPARYEMTASNGQIAALWATA